MHAGWGRRKVSAFPESLNGNLINSATNVTLPERPKWNESFLPTPEKVDDGLPPILTNGMHFTSPRHDEYSRLMQEYGMSAYPLSTCSLLIPVHLHDQRIS
jgi:hypothetical protein